MNLKNKEIEKKFLIEYPANDILSNIPPEDRSHIIQTYLLSEESITARVRLRRYKDTVRYYKTEKKHISDMSSYEDEKEISLSDYKSELKNADPKRCPIEKERLILRNGGHLFEIDIYPFWSDRAIMEVELQSEDEEFEIPNGIRILRDVTSDRRYKNAALAKEIPTD